MANKENIASRREIGALMLAAGLTGAVSFLSPRRSEDFASVNLNRDFPSSPVGWNQRVVAQDQTVSVVPRDGVSMNQPYEQSILRNFHSTKFGEQVMQALAWNSALTQEIKVHEPEACYVAQGAKILEAGLYMRAADAGLNIEKIKIRWFAAQLSSGVYEYVLYWIRSGNVFYENATQNRLHILSAGLLHQQLLDGMLFRVSIRSTSMTDWGRLNPIFIDYIGSIIDALPVGLKKLIIDV